VNEELPVMIREGKKEDLHIAHKHHGGVCWVWGGQWVSTLCGAASGGVFSQKAVHLLRSLQSVASKQGFS